MLHQPDRLAGRAGPDSGCALLHGGQGAVGGPAVGVVDGRGEFVALGAEAVHRPLGLAHQVHQAGSVAAADLVAAGHAVWGESAGNNPMIDPMP